MVSLGIEVLLVLAVTYGGVQADIGCLVSGANTSVKAEPGEFNMGLHACGSHNHLCAHLYRMSNAT